LNQLGLKEGVKSNSFLIMYILPNKKPINSDKPEKAFCDADPKKIFYLDAIIGEVISGRDITKAKNILDELRF
jgi:hypothetical protein